MTGFLIAGTSSGVGKTTATLAIAAALGARGKIIQLFKGGPDFLDTGHHSRVTTRKSRNLDTWMLSHEANCDIVRKAAQGADVLIVEGMMGLFDGKSGADEQGSSAEIAKTFKLPVVLIVDASKSARSVAAVVLGFEMFDPDLPLAGVILNRVAGERHFHMLEAAILSRCHTQVLGWLPRESAIAIPERHLGLQTAEELSEAKLEQQIKALSAVGENYLRLDRLIALQCGLDLTPEQPNQTRAATRTRIGVAYDSAFTFYYEDNLELLRELGAEIIFFSPLNDSSLPPMLDAIYLGGGYPELHAEQLSRNVPMLHAMMEFADSQRPVYAECGGMMYLTTSLTTSDGKAFGMAGILHAQVEMTSRLSRFGYVNVTFTRDCLLGPMGTTIRGHSFHYSHIISSEGLTSSYQVDYSLSSRQEDEGFGTVSANILASYVHLHFRANPVVAENFIAAAIAGRAHQLILH